jgi:hypothetical protein
MAATTRSFFFLAALAAESFVSVAFAEELFNFTYVSSTSGLLSAELIVDQLWLEMSTVGARCVLACIVVFYLFSRALPHSYLFCYALARLPVALAQLSVALYFLLYSTLFFCCISIHSHLFILLFRYVDI